MPVESREQILPGAEQNVTDIKIAASIGSIAVENTRLTEETPPLSLSQLQIDVLSLTSKGQTAKQIGRQLKISSRGVKDVKKNLSDKLPSLAAGVNQAIQDGLINVEHKPDLELTSQLTALDIGILQAYSFGGSTAEVTEISGSDYKTVNEHESDLFKKIKAWSRPHAVRRAYELGIFSVSKVSSA